MKDWRESSNVFVTNGDSSHSGKDRVDMDYYATDPECLHKLLEYESFDSRIWEPCCGGGHLSYLLKERGYDVVCSDIVDRIGNDVYDFVYGPIRHFGGDIITNPPYSKARECVENALMSVNEGNKVAMFLKLTFLEGKSRRSLFENYPPHTIYVFSERQKCAPNGDFDSIKSSAVCYAWFVWVKGFIGEPVIKWI